MWFHQGYWIVIVLQGLCLLHAIRHRADQRWFFMLFFLPVFGAVMYLVAEVLPRLRAQGGVEVPLPFFARRHLRQLEEQLRFSDTVDNRVALADAYVAHGRTGEAVKLYEPCLAGVARANPYLLLHYAQACLAAGDAQPALAALDRVDPERGDRIKERRLARARALDALARHDEAEAAYRHAARGFDGEEARVRLGEFLWARGRRDEAIALFNEVLEYARINDRDFRRRERMWIAIAKARLREPVAGAAKAAA